MPRDIIVAAPGAGRAVDGVEIIGGGVFAHAQAAEADGTPTAGTRVPFGPLSQLIMCR